MNIFQRCVVSMTLRQLLALLHDCGTSVATFVLAQFAVAIKFIVTSCSLSRRLGWQTLVEGKHVSDEDLSKV